MQKLISKLISRLKGEEYKLDPSIGASDILSTLSRRFAQVARGYIKRIGMRKCKGLLFCGKKVKVLHKNKVSIDGTAILEDYVFINALSKNGVKIGKNVSIGRNSIIECTGVIRELGEGLVIGDNVGIAANAFLAVRGPVEIGENTIIGPGVSLHAENHVFADRDIPIRLQGSDRKGVTIGKDCWIGSKVVILDGVKIGDGCVVAAGAVVNKSFPSYTIIGGVPAKILKYRGESLENISN